MGFSTTISAKGILFTEEMYLSTMNNISTKEREFLGKDILKASYEEEKQHIGKYFIFVKIEYSSKGNLKSVTHVLKYISEKERFIFKIDDIISKSQNDFGKILDYDSIDISFV